MNLGSMFGGAILLVVLGFRLHTPILIGAVVPYVIIGACIDLIVRWTSIRATFVDTNNVTLAGVCPTFDEELVELRRKRETEGGPPKPIIGSYSFPDPSQCKQEEDDNPFANLT
jgi:hypothetical protein